MSDGRTDRNMVATELLVDPFSSLAGLADAVIVVHTLGLPTSYIRCFVSSPHAFAGRRWGKAPPIRPCVGACGPAGAAEQSLRVNAQVTKDRCSHAVRHR